MPSLKYKQLWPVRWGRSPKVRRKFSPLFPSSSSDAWLIGRWKGKITLSELMNPWVLAWHEVVNGGAVIILLPDPPPSTTQPRALWRFTVWRTIYGTALHSWVSLIPNLPHFLQVIMGSETKWRENGHPSLLTLSGRTESGRQCVGLKWEMKLRLQQNSPAWNWTLVKTGSLYGRAERKTIGKSSSINQWGVGPYPFSLSTYIVPHFLPKMHIMGNLGRGKIRH